MNSGLVKQSDNQNKTANKDGKRFEREKGLPFSNSSTTVYHNLLNPVGEIIQSDDRNPEPMEVEHEVDSEITFKIKKNRDSSSSEDRVNMSDEFVNMDCDQFIADCQAEASHGHLARERSPHRDKNPYERGERMIKEAEVNKKRMLALPGNESMGKNQSGALAGVATGLEILCAVKYDQEYMVVGAHLDNSLEEKVIKFEYINFAKLIPKDRITKTEDHCMELIIRGGSMYFAPVSDRENTVISNFSKWEQAFRIYSNILTRAYPAKASELIQYNHTIYTASLTFSWDNIYNYDKEFCMHISKFPQCSWSIILQQAWSMCLKDKVQNSDENRANNSFNNSGHWSSRNKEICKRFNKGKCTYGSSCKFDHCCAVPKCGKFGHGAHICRNKNNGDSEGGGPNVNSNRVNNNSTSGSRGSRRTNNENN